MSDRIYLKFLEWCETNINIRTLILTSSRANPNVKTDILSDFDIELYVNDLVPFSVNDSWIESFGSILARWPLYPKSTLMPGWITRLIQFEDGLRIDFQITDKKPAYHDNFDAGYKIILDKDNIASSLKKTDFSKLNIKKPSKEQFDEKINAFFWDSLYVAKCLYRDELFYAKYMLDSVLRFHFLQVFIEWYIGLNNNWNVSTNKFGRRFKEYLEPEIWKQIEDTFAGSLLEENWDALFRMIDLTGMLGRVICRELGFNYPQKLESGVLKYIKKIKSPDQI